MNKIYEKTMLLLKKHVSIVAICCLAFSVLTAILYTFAVAFPSFADFFQNSVAKFLRFLFAKLSNIFPFSLAELLLLLVPMALIVVIAYFIVLISRYHTRAVRPLLSFFSACLAFYCLFVWMFGIGCHTTPIEKKIGLDRELISVQELRTTAFVLVKEINALTPKIAFAPSGSSVMPYTLNDLNDKLNNAYQGLYDRYSFLQGMRTKVKGVANSHWMAYTNLTGIYTFYTGEANINLIYPDYTIPYTVAHELAHQRGVSREDEAQFIAFLACMECEDSYIRYSAYLNLYEYVASQLYSVDSQAYFSVLSHLSKDALGEMVANNEFCKPYRESKISEVSRSVNDAYLKSYGQTEGVRSYGLVVDLAVAYYRQNGFLT